MGGINDLGAIRERLGWTQHKMADALDIGLRTYVEAEGSDRPKKAYVLAAQYLASQEPGYDFDPGVPMSSPTDEAAAHTSAAMYVASIALYVALKNDPDSKEGFNRSAYLFDECNAEDVDLISRRGAYLAAQVVHQEAIETEKARPG